MEPEDLELESKAEEYVIDSHYHEVEEDGICIGKFSNRETQSDESWKLTVKEVCPMGRSKSEGSENGLVEFEVI